MALDKVLIVDDDKDLSWIIAEMLQDYGYKVLCAADSAYGYDTRKAHEICRSYYQKMR